MAEIPPTQGSKALKIVLIVAAILVGLCAVCVAGAWFMGGKAVWRLAMPFAGLQSAAAAKYPQGAGITMTGDSPETLTLALGVKNGVKPEELAEAQDWLWKEYAKAFSDGGLPVKRIAVGKWGGGSNVTWTDDGEIAIEAVAARTGVPAPAVDEFLATQMAEGDSSGHLKVKVTGTGDGAAPEKDDGKAPDEQK